MSAIAESAPALNNEVPDAKTRTCGGRSPKRKGNGFEREVVAALQELGLAAERVPLSGGVKTSKFDHDISCPVRGVDRRLECKRRARAFATIDAMLAGNFALIVRDDRSRPLVVMTLTTFAELARQPNSEASSPQGDKVRAAANAGVRCCRERKGCGMKARAAAIEAFINETTRCFGAPPASVVLRR